jgi:hypothetical protein
MRANPTIPRPGDVGLARIVLIESIASSQSRANPTYARRAIAAWTFAMKATRCASLATFM